METNGSEAQNSDVVRQRYKSDLVRTSEEREAVFAVRMIVFVEEQNVPPEEELDILDITATHFLVRRNIKNENANGNNQGNAADRADIVGTARLVDKGAGIGKIGRVAILREHRGQGVGALLMRFVEQIARARGYTRLVLEAQCYAIPFYEKLGYTAEGEIFLDCNIEHRLMSKVID